MPILESLTKEENQALADALNFSAEEILAIPENQPHRLFRHPNKNYVSVFYKKLAFIWHPDHRKDPTGTVFKHISVLYNQAKIQERAFSEKTVETELVWQDGSIHIDTLTGKKLIFPYIKTEEFELGHRVFTPDTIIYLIRSDFEDLFDNAVRVIQGFHYPDEKLKQNLGPCLPEIIGRYATSNFKVLIVKKPSGLICLRDLLDFPLLQKKLEPYHTAWILSRLHNIACYLEWAQLSHQAITLNSCFIEPKGHGFALLDGWWYARKVGEKILGLPGNLTNFMPEVMKTGVAQKASDFSLIRRACLQLLGNSRGFGYFTYPNDVPPIMLEWLRKKNQKPALVQYRQWKDEIRPTLFLDKKGLVPLNIQSKQVYPNLGAFRAYTTLTRRSFSNLPHLLFSAKNNERDPIQKIIGYIPTVLKKIKF